MRYCAPFYGYYTVSDDIPSSVSFTPSSLKCDDIDPDEPLLHNDLPGQYLVLEDLNASYRCPCILDMKLGTRTYWDGAPPEKVERHIRVCKATTSGSLGIRICGMRTYQPNSGRRVLKDKVYGKSLTNGTLQNALALFFFDGKDFRNDIIDIMLSKLRNLREVVKRSHWRFWSSSILFTYEGCGETKADVHLIDFGNCNFSGKYDTPDDGCILAISNLVAYLQLIRNGIVPKECMPYI
ncbi:hypothetical protein WA588_003139 [Blastocystis sp. NMH]